MNNHRLFGNGKSGSVPPDLDVRTVCIGDSAHMKRRENRIYTTRKASALRVGGRAKVYFSDVFTKTFGGVFRVARALPSEQGDGWRVFVLEKQT